LYAALVIGFAPISNLPIQVRVADILLPLAILFGWPMILGLGIGTVVGNLFADSITGFPSASIGLDVVGGSFANLLAGFLAWKIGQQALLVRGFNVSWIIGSFVETTVISVIVGGYLSIVFSIPLAISILSILLGEIIAINIGGLLLLGVLAKPKSLDPLRSQGQRVYVRDQIH
jgi:uncharacterized membrane protein